MAVFRVERNKGYTVMSNHHLRNKELTLKAKGLLSQMLSLPEDWDYTLAGLSQINRESIDAIRTAVWELEKAGYIKRRQGRDEKGKMTAIEYTIYEQPQPPDDTPPGLDNPTLENPTPGNPILENPTPGKPTTENPMQLNKDIQRTDLLPTMPEIFILPNFHKRKTLQSSKKITTLSIPCSLVTDISYLPSVSTSAISFAVALTIRMPVSLIPSRSASSCRRCVFFSGGVSKRNWSTDIL